MKSNKILSFLQCLTCISSLSVFKIKDVLHPFKYCVISLYEYGTDSKTQTRFFETLVDKSFTLSIALVQNKDKTVETFQGNGKHSCEILIINGIIPSRNGHDYRYRQIDMAHRNFNVQRELVLFVAVSRDPLRGVRNIFHKYLYYYHENIIAMQVSPKESYQIVGLHRFQWYCSTDEISCVVKLPLINFLESLKTCHNDHMCFLRKVSQSFAYGKNFNGWQVLTKNAYMIDNLTNWEFYHGLILRQAWGLKSTDNVDVLLKIISELALARNFTPAVKSQVRYYHQSMDLPTIHPYIHMDEENIFSLYFAVPTEGYYFLQCFFQTAGEFQPPTNFPVPGYLHMDAHFSIHWSHFDLQEPKLLSS
ncbi:unnamed protein product [Allacma fusca]|uniref:Uncharacterized protein n=1 Tax=Allacma fusca TaxID=39272 RepID=A0A8J2KJL7_9HEXA|nr:unnamed protein product [Allacma fusca]